jgi:hypothetical protein
MSMTSILEPGPARERRPSMRVNWNAVAVVIALIVALLGWFRDDSKDNEGRAQALERRLSILETQRLSDTGRMERIENKLDRLLERVQR